MRLYYNQKTSKGWKSEKQLEFLNRLIQYTNIPYYGEYMRYSLPESFNNRLPYIESNEIGDGITIRRLTHLPDNLKYDFQEYTDKIYNMVMGIEEENWDDMVNLYFKLDDDNKTLKFMYSDSKDMWEQRED